MKTTGINEKMWDMDPTMDTSQHLTVSEQQLNEAYHWLYQCRKHFPPNADIWVFRRDWNSYKINLLHQINRGDYLFSAVRRLYKRDGQVIHLWSSQDALVMKVLVDLLQPQLSLSSSCTHIKGHGGLKQSVVRIQRYLDAYQFVCKTDVKHFYESIDQYLLIEQIYQHIDNKILRRYLYQVVRRTVEYGGNYQDITQGISRGCPLSPLLGALYLKTLDKVFDTNTSYFYLRYMDDILILSKTRWQNRKAVRLLNQVFSELKIAQHPDKTFIGRIEKGFDFLGYHFSRKTLQLADITVRKHVEHIVRLYEQQMLKKVTLHEMTLILDHYVKRWQRWCTAGLSEFRQLLEIACENTQLNQAALIP